MNLGFETIGNATLIAHDAGPVLVTDPWIVGSAYFGSWTRSHEIPEEQMLAIRSCWYVWLSHGHPDHLGAESLALLRDKEILLPDHVGGASAATWSGRGSRCTSSTTAPGRRSRRASGSRAWPTTTRTPSCSWTSTAGWW
jgi:L-ascorbate metabolism protein UlaG (beta-lactamase superfamily)